MSVIALREAGAECGGKAAGLATLMRSGLPVPDGFVVIGPDPSVEAVAGQLRRLGASAVAVRSSGLAEDGVTASFAGQFESVLGARGLDEVMAAIRRCAASAQRPAAQTYREQLGREREAVLPVIVQELIEADRAGVLFTRDPRTGADTVVINASWGLGESVVSGAVVPDEIAVSPGMVEITIGSKETRLDLTGDVLTRTPAADHGRCCLTGAEIDRLVRLGLHCAELFGGPQDIEWALAGDRTWLLQSRPITGPSARRARGPARVVRSVDEFSRVRAGDVLVCRTTDPAWTPLFRIAAAVVTESGGVLSHAAIVAREFGIPAVVGLPGAMTRFADGAMITVDEVAGTVVPDSATTAAVPPAEMLVLHAVRLKGFADTEVIAARFGLDAQQTGEDLLDAQACGRVSRSSFADLAGWSLTEAGRRRNEEQLRDELNGSGARAEITAVLDDFIPLNARATQAFTAWQLGGDASARGSLGELGVGLGRLEQRLIRHLTRFSGYHRRFTEALDRAEADPRWITGVEVDSCHRVWFELHEDLVATLGVTR